MLWVCLSSLRSFKKTKTRNEIELSTGKILEENHVLFAFQQTLGDKFTFQQDNNLKHKANYTLELLTKTTLNVPEWPSYIFLLQSAWKSMARLAMINNQLDKKIMCKYVQPRCAKLLETYPERPTAASVRCLCSFAHLFFLLASLRHDFFLAALHRMPASQSCFFAVDVETGANG